MVYNPQLALRAPKAKVGDKVRLFPAEPCRMCGKSGKFMVVAEVSREGKPQVLWCPRCYEAYREGQGI